MWKYFTEDELKCKGTDECYMDGQFMAQLEALRHEFNEPMVISSAYRSIGYNTTVSTTIRLHWDRSISERAT